MRQYDLKVKTEEAFKTEVDGVIGDVFYDTDKNEYKKGFYLKHIAEASRLGELGIGKDGFEIRAILRITILDKNPTKIFQKMDELEELINYKTINDIYFVESFVGGSCYKIDNAGVYQGFVDYSIKICN